MNEAVDSGRGRWGTAIALTLLVLVLSVFDPLALVAIPLAMLVIGLPTDRRAFWAGIGFALWIVVLFPAADPLVQVSRGWALILGLAFLGLGLFRPGWPVTERAIAATGIALGVGSIAAVLAGGVGGVDDLIRSHLDDLSRLLFEDLETRARGTPWVAELAAAAEVLAERQVYLFPAYLGLQSVAALALVTWWVRRIGRSGEAAFRLGGMKEFRFNDQLVWVLILGAVLLVLFPLIPEVTRVGVNLVVFMGALYALRGFAIFVFLAMGPGSFFRMTLGVFVLIMLYPLALTAALLMGLGDTWLDVRRRVTRATPT